MKDPPAAAVAKRTWFKRKVSTVGASSSGKSGASTHAPARRVSRVPTSPTPAPGVISLANQTITPELVLGFKSACTSMCYKTTQRFSSVFLFFKNPTKNRGAPA